MTGPSSSVEDDEEESAGDGGSISASMVPLRLKDLGRGLALDISINAIFKFVDSPSFIVKVTQF
jgi:hypothetical protein